MYEKELVSLGILNSNAHAVLRYHLAVADHPRSTLTSCKMSKGKSQIWPYSLYGALWSPEGFELCGVAHSGSFLQLLRAWSSAQCFPGFSSVLLHRVCPHAGQLVLQGARSITFFCSGLVP